MGLAPGWCPAVSRGLHRFSDGRRRPRACDRPGGQLRAGDADKDGGPPLKSFRGSDEGSLPGPAALSPAEPLALHSEGVEVRVGGRGGEAEVAGCPVSTGARATGVPGVRPSSSRQPCWKPALLLSLPPSWASWLREGPHPAQGHTAARGVRAQPGSFRPEPGTRPLLCGPRCVARPGLSLPWMARSAF